MKTNPREYTLALEIEEAKERREFGRVSKLTKELIAIQKGYKYPEPPSDDIMVRKFGVRRRHLELERELLPQIKEAEAAGDHDKAKELRAKLKEVQSEQPKNFGTKLK